MPNQTECGTMLSLKWKRYMYMRPEIKNNPVSLEIPIFLGDVLGINPRTLLRQRYCLRFLYSKPIEFSVEIIIIKHTHNSP